MDKEAKEQYVETLREKYLKPIKKEKGEYWMSIAEIQN